MKYRVGLTQVVYEGLTIEVEADNAEQAEELALATANNNDADIMAKWKFIDVGDIDVVSIDEVI